MSAPKSIVRPAPSAIRAMQNDHSTQRSPARLGASLVAATRCEARPATSLATPSAYALRPRRPRPRSAIAVRLARLHGGRGFRRADPALAALRELEDPGALQATVDSQPYPLASREL